MSNVMRDDRVSKQRVAMLALLALLVADVWWLGAAVVDGLQRVDFPRLVLGIALQAFGIWALVSKVTNSAPGSRVPSLFVLASLALGAAGVWYGLLHAGEARVSPSIWKR